MIEDAVRTDSPSWVNAKIDRETLATLERFKGAAPEEIEKQIDELAWEYDVSCAASLSLSAIGVAGAAIAIKYPRFVFVPLAASGLLLLQSLPFPEPVTTLFRTLGFRSRTEIERERHALKMLRGDYERAEDDPSAKGAMTAAQSEGKVKGKKTTKKAKNKIEEPLGEELKPLDTPFEPGDSLN